MLPARTCTLRLFNSIFPYKLTGSFTFLPLANPEHLPLDSLPSDILKEEDEHTKLVVQIVYIEKYIYADELNILFSFQSESE